MTAKQETATIREARARMQTHIAKLDERDVLDQKNRVDELHQGVTEFVQGMNEIFPKGISVHPAVAFDGTNGLDQWVRGALRTEYDKRNGVSTAVKLLAADHAGEPGITLAVVNLNVVESHRDWILVSADLRTVEGGIGFHIYNQGKVDPNSVTNKSLIEGDIEGAKKNPFDHTKKLLEYSEPLLAFAADTFKRAVSEKIRSMPLKRSGGSE